MEDERDWMTGPRYDRGAAKEIQRWGHEEGSVVINGQKVAWILSPSRFSSEKSFTSFALNRFGAASFPESMPAIALIRGGDSQPAT